MSGVTVRCWRALVRIAWKAAVADTAEPSQSLWVTRREQGGIIARRRSVRVRSCSARGFEQAWVVGASMRQSSDGMRQSVELGAGQRRRLLGASGRPGAEQGGHAGAWVPSRS